MPQVVYSVDLVEETWTVGLNGKSFGPYSSFEVATAAASRAAHAAEAQGYEVFLYLNTAPEAASPPPQPKADAA